MTNPIPVIKHVVLVGRFYCKVSEHLQRVMDQVRVIQESAQATNELLKDRIADAFLDIQR